MARKQTTVTIQDAGRDHGKTFLLTEMPSSQGEYWAAKAFLALSKSGVDVPDNIASMGMAGIATLGIKALSGVPWEAAEPLLAEMFQCIQIIPNPAKPAVVRALVEDDIEEIATRVRLRVEVFKLHTDFSLAGARSTSA